MPATITTDIGMKPGIGGGTGRGPSGPGSDDSKEWPPGWTRDDALEPQKYRIGMWVGLASVLMLFMSLTSAYIVRGVPALNGGLDDWIPIAIPAVLWFDTIVLLVSSVSIELARRALRQNDYASFKAWISLTTLLGVAFLAGQVAAWRELSAQGVYINSHPHSSFFYLLTSLHGLHLFGGVIALLYVTVAAYRMRIGFKRRTAVNVTAIYWHFMDGLWIYLFGLLFFFR
ncbi:MAG TPA: cytochrome c oxidase subunit 3 [Blastocatellia bacterium]|nr:cytochrome c oxidase subunit 3 [Blastocatellia bacterium]